MADYIQWLRSKIGKMKVPVVFACAVVHDGNGKVLWQQRSDFGWWGLPGGVVELDESLEEALIREVYEECGLTVIPQRLLGIYSTPDFDVDYPNGDQVQQITFTFVCLAQTGELTIDPVESLAFDWLSEQNLPQTSPWYTAMIKDYLSKGEAVFYQHGQAGKRVDPLPLYKKIRRFIGKAPYVATGSGAIVLDASGRVLLQRRGDNGQWGIPGGSLEVGERIDETVRQEVWEETGLTVEVVRLSGVYSDERFFVVYPNGDQMKVVVVVFVCRVLGGTLTADGEESLELRYFSRKDFPPMEARILSVIDDALCGENHVVIS